MMQKLRYTILGFFFLTAVTVYLNSCGGGGGSDGSSAIISTASAVHEHDFSENSGIFAGMDHTIVFDLESSNAEQVHENDSVTAGHDKIPVKHMKTSDVTYCFYDDDDEEHDMKLINESGEVVVHVKADHDCVTESIEEGLYSMNLYHGGEDEDENPDTVFVYPSEKAGELSPGGNGGSSITITTNKCLQCDLSNMNLSYAQLRGADLSYANLSNSNLSFADFSQANLSYANFCNALETGAIFRGANITKATSSNCIEQTMCAIQSVETLSPVWSSPYKLPGTPCDTGSTVRRTKIARGERDGDFLAFYSATNNKDTIQAQAFSISQSGVEPLCEGKSFLIIDGGKSTKLFDFNVIRRDREQTDNYYLAYESSPAGSDAHYKHSAMLNFDRNNCTMTLMQDIIINSYNDFYCDKPDEPFTVDRGDGILINDYWEEEVSFCDYKDGDIGLRYTVYDYDMSGSTGVTITLSSGLPYSSNYRPIFMNDGVYNPFTRIFHGVYRPEGYYICYNATPDGKGEMDYNTTTKGTFMNIYCGKYDLDDRGTLYNAPECSVDIVDDRGLDEIFLQGVTLLPGGSEDQPLLTLYSYDNDGVVECPDGTNNCFDEIRLTDMTENHITVFPHTDAYSWGASEDGFTDTIEAIGSVAVVTAVNKYDACTYVNLVKIAVTD